MNRRYLGPKRQLHPFFSQSPFTYRGLLYLPQLFVRTIASAPCSPRRRLPTSGFVTLDPNTKIEEEHLPSYIPDDYYPVYIGEVLGSRYQVVGKLGFGANSTVWLCRDLRQREHRFLTLKLRVRSKEHNHVIHDQETTICDYLKSQSLEHPGKNRVRRVLDSFEIAGPNGNHKCILYQPLGMSFTEFLRLLPEHRFPKELAQKSIQLILIALDYLHQCDIFHTDISPNNVLQGIEDDSIFAEMEQGELEQPIARKVLRDRTVYNSRPMPFSAGQAVLCDLGEARIGTSKHSGDIMPGIYRAPEVILGIDWDAKVDIWAIGIMMWDLLEGGHLFFAKKHGVLNDEQHLAEMVSLLGPPPPEFLKRSPKCSQYWDSQGNWNGSIPIPEQSFDSREQWLHGEDRALFLHFIRSTLCWIPEERPTAEELAFDEFLMQPYAAAFSKALAED
ncbi:hypothetical protein ONS95_005224 [Cadophora gregata]|uniref:uncharacterized protein n=1 Tax=Cadophora gregata TaxID=51156 RepID=UPI0026DAE525|nr:uncharacterized protein ONS95_005224 [Cadophora gregata]KAK0104963.1 hypothetical protein ONS95_005224 [Cadophora gregata]